MDTLQNNHNFVSLTRLHIRSLRFLPQFMWTNEGIVKQLLSTHGFLAGKLSVAGPREFWTVTVWTDETSMRKYRSAGAHLKAIGRLAEWCDEASVAHWSQDSEAMPDWETLHQRMQDTGRRSRVNHPSKGHASEPWTLPLPRWRLERPLKGANPGSTTVLPPVTP